MLRFQTMMVCGLLLFLSYIAPIYGEIGEAEIRFLTDGVEGIAPTGVPGPLCVFGKNAAPILAGKEGNSLAPLLAAAKFGKGRVIAFGHGGYLSKELLTQKYGSKRLVSNIVRWLAAGNQSPRIAVVGSPELADFIATLGYEGQKLDSLTDPKAAGQFQILVMDCAHLPMNQIERISKFVSNGGGLCTASLGWGWLQVSGKTDLKTEHTGNLLLSPMGIVWTDGYLGTTLKKDGVDLYAVSTDIPLKFINVTESIIAVDAHEKGTKKLTPNEIAQAIATIERGIRSIPARQSSVLAPLKQYVDREVIPTEKNKIRKNLMIADVLAVTLQTERYLNRQRTNGIPRDGILFLPAGNDFPGSVPNDAKTVSQKIKIDTKIPAWHSTGLYAAPGSTVTVKLPKDFSVPKNSTLSVRIGCHRDKLWGKDEWKRFPEITIEIPCRDETTKIVNPFGGLVYIVVPRNFDKGEITVQISGCIEAPLFVFGKTKIDDWKKVIRNAPAPWGELASDRVILSLPSQHLRELDDPDAVMEFWNKVLDDDAELCGSPVKRERPERIVCDRQISAGSLHSGYPVMTHMDAGKEFINLHNHPEKGWGFYHEFGHNHQSGDWTFDGTVEVTVNLFTLYNLKQFGIKRESAHLQQKTEQRTKKRDKYFAAGSPFDQWKSDPFLALIMYSDIIDEFGWEPFKAVFREYRELKKEERPKNDDKKRDQWLIRLSRQLGKNLGPYFDRWGIPVSQTAKNAVKELPEWLPY
ncbi:MAG: M60 family metallopeptidase [Planctomycetaceae bacterium]|nr:M60 family metallopeptidase [Planctomycetaceae bacterium]